MSNLLFSFIHVPIFTFLDESEEEGVVQPLSKDEEEVEVMRSWVEVGGVPAQPEEEAKGLLSRGKFVPLSPILHSSLYFSIGAEFSLTILAFCLNFPLFFRI